MKKVIAILVSGLFASAAFAAAPVAEKAPMTPEKAELASPAEAGKAAPVDGIKAAPAEAVKAVPADGLKVAPADAGKPLPSRDAAIGK